MEIRQIAIGLRRNGKDRYKAFIDSDFPEGFGWTAAAFEPMTREEGQQYFGDLKLA